MNEKVFLVTDGCMWEANKENGTFYPHSIEVVDIETGAVRYIKSGSHIAFLEGEITNTRSQKTYNRATTLPSDGQSVQKRTRGKGKSSTKETTSV